VLFNIVVDRGCHYVFVVNGLYYTVLVSLEADCQCKLMQQR